MLTISGIGRYVQQDPPSCPVRCPFEDECRSDETGICLLREQKLDGESSRADMAFHEAQDRQLQGGIS